LSPLIWPVAVGSNHDADSAPAYQISAQKNGDVWLSYCDSTNLLGHFPFLGHVVTTAVPITRARAGQKLIVGVLCLGFQLCSSSAFYFVHEKNNFIKT